MIFYCFFLTRAVKKDRLSVFGTDFFTIETRVDFVHNLGKIVSYGTNINV